MGMGNQTKEVSAWLRQNGCGSNIAFIVDNFKYTFCNEYEGIPVLRPDDMGGWDDDGEMAGTAGGIRYGQR